MASATQTSAQPSSTTTEPTQQTAQLELAVVLALHRWPALSTAVSSQWGGPSSADKRDWFAGFLADYLSSEPDADAADVESMLLDFLETEFDTRLEDESEADVAQTLIVVREQLRDGVTLGLDKLRVWWQEKGQKTQATIAQGHLPASAVGADPEGEEEEWSEDDQDDDEDGGVEVVMDDAPPLLVPAQPRPKAVPEVDEDGFTKVVGKRRY